MITDEMRMFIYVYFSGDIICNICYICNQCNHCFTFECEKEIARKKKKILLSKKKKNYKIINGFHK